MQEGAAAGGDEPAMAMGSKDCGMSIYVPDLSFACWRMEDNCKGSGWTPQLSRRAPRQRKPEKEPGKKPYTLKRVEAFECRFLLFVLFVMLHRLCVMMW